MYVVFLLIYDLSIHFFFRLLLWIDLRRNIVRGRSGHRRPCLFVVVYLPPAVLPLSRLPLPLPNPCADKSSFGNDGNRMRFELRDCRRGADPPKNESEMTGAYFIERPEC